VVSGFAVGAAAGLVLGAAMGLSRRVDEHVRPLFTAVAQVPALAWIPLVMLLLGIGETLKIVVIAKAAFVPVTMNTSAGIANVPRALVEVGETFRFTRMQMLRHVVLPGAVPPIFTGLRYGLTMPGSHWSVSNCSRRPKVWAISWSGAGRCSGSTRCWSR
jgi:sulfonate transport system permease protein